MAQIEPKKRARALKNAVKMVSSQALTLDRIFGQAVKGASPGTMNFHQDMRLALKAQSQYRATLKILLALEETRNSSEQTIADGDSPA